MDDDGARLIDFPTLLLVLAGAIYLGVLGIWNFDAIKAWFGEDARWPYVVIGVAGVWQITRQRFR